MNDACLFLRSPTGGAKGMLLPGLLLTANPGESSFMLLLGLGLAAAALICFALEIFVPSGGLLGLTCALCVIGSTAAFFMHSPMLGVAAAAVYCILSPILLVVGLRIWSHSPIARRLILGAADDLDPDAEERPTGPVPASSRQVELQRLVGVEGIAATPLRPVGFVTIAGRRIDALAEGPVIDAGTAVVVVGLLDNQIKVRPAPEHTVPNAAQRDPQPESGTR